MLAPKQPFNLVEKTRNGNRIDYQMYNFKKKETGIQNSIDNVRKQEFLKLKSTPIRKRLPVKIPSKHYSSIENGING